jgi:hypothetical protein
LIKKTLRENVIPFTGDRSRSSWRKKILREFGEWAPIDSPGPTNSTSTTFGYFVGGEPAVNYETGQQITFTYSGLDGVENYPTSITIDQGFGEVHTTDSPPFSQVGVQGYTAKLNPRYKEAQEKYKKEYDEFKAKSDANFQAIKDTLKSFGTSWEEMRASKKWVKKLPDGTVVAIVPTGSNPSLMDWTNNVKVVKMKQCANASGPMTINYNPPGQYQDWVVENAEIQNEVYLEIGEPPKPPMESEYLMPRRTDYRDVNPLLDASQESAQQVGADYMMNARVQDAPEQPSFLTKKNTPKQPSKRGRVQVANNTSMLPTFNGVPRYNPLANPQIPDGFPLSDAIANTLRYTTGNYDPKVPVKGGQSAALELSMLNTMSNAINSGTLSRDPGRPGFFKVGVRYDGIPKPNSPEGTEFARNDWEGDGSIGNNYATNMSAQGLLQIYSFKPTKNGILVKDRFNLDGSRNAGAVRAIPGAQQVVDFLVNMGDDKIRQRGGNPKDDATAGFDLEYEIPWERVPNNHPLRGNMKESTWDRIQKYR